MTNALQQAFEKRATELGFKIRKDDEGRYIYEHTNRLWSWYEAGAHSVLELADPAFGFNQSYEG